MIDQIKELPKTVLWVDDEKEMVDPFIDTFADAGISVKYVQSPREGIKALEAGNFDWLISDFTMPELSGAELIEKLIENGKCPSTVFLLSSLFPMHFSESAFAQKVGDKIERFMSGEKIPTTKRIVQRLQDLKTG